MAKNNFVAEVTFNKRDVLAFSTIHATGNAEVTLRGDE